MRRFSLFLHRWLGLTIGIIIAWLGLSGSALVYRKELEAKLAPELLRVQPGEKARPWDDVMARVREAQPEKQISLVFVAKTPEESHEFWLDKGDLRVYVNPYTGAILGQQAKMDGFFTWLADGHIHLFSGENGEKVTGWCGLTLFALSVSGLVLWFPRRKSGWKRAFTPHMHTNWKGRVYELHRAGGFWVCGLLAMTSISGASLVWPDSAMAVLGKAFTTEVPAKVKASKGEMGSVDALVASANAAFPDGQLIRISFPAKAGAPVVVRKRLVGELHPNGMNNISLDPASAKVLRVDDTRRAGPMQRVMNMRYPLHIGAWGGNFTRPLYVLLGWTPALLGISGFLMWRRRVNAGRNSGRKKAAGQRVASGA